MGLDIAAYSKAFDRFLVTMAQLREPFIPEFQSIFEEITSFLRIGRIESFFYQNPHFEKMGNGAKTVLYGKEPEQTVPMQKRSVSESGTVFILKIFPKANEESWTPEETEKIQVLISMLFTFSSNAKLTKFVEEATYYDLELHLPNLHYFTKTAAEMISNSKMEYYAVSFFNIKGLSKINQRIGRKNANLSLVIFRNNLLETLKDDACICRVGGDNFILMVKKDKLDYVIQYLQGTQVTYNPETNDSIFISTRAGYYMVSENDTSIDAIIDKAHTAVQSAKKSTNASYIIYNDQLQLKKDKALIIESMFMEALKKDEFTVYYQPKIFLKNFKVGGAEGLCRWIHDGHVINPKDFIPVLEQSNFICQLDFYILDKVCQHIRRWLDQDLRVVPVSMNLSRRHMGDTDLIKHLVEIIDKYNVPHNYIEIELKETNTDIEFSDLKSIVSGLKLQGIHSSVDDFGIGYSSINLIRQVSWDIVKIDKSFLPKSKANNESQYSMLRHLFSMIHDMGLKCIVEGVENEEQVEMLRENGCYLAQGYFFDHPLTLEEFEQKHLEKM